MLEMIRSLNSKQREILHVVNKLLRDQLESLNSKSKQKNVPTNLYLTESAGTGKSHCLITMRHYLDKSFSYQSGEVKKERMIIIAGAVAVNLDGTTIYSAFFVSPDCNYQKFIPQLSYKRRCLLRNKYSDLTEIIIDKISMISIGCSSDIAFAGILIIICRDLYQLPPFQQRLVHRNFLC